jgi:multidrug efflux system membrane fusion protein
VGFAQGDEVHEGQMLFTIDPAPYEVALAQAEAALARDGATNDLAQTETKRYTDLASRGLVSSEQNQQEQSTATAAAATVRADQAAVNAAKLNLSYCTITSPIEGRTGKLLVQPGNLVSANTTVLVMINQLSPIYVSFSVPQQYLDALRAADRARSLQVAAAASGQSATESGDLSFINNAIDSTTATLQLMARFPNREERLWPGEFVNIELTLSVQKNATVVPATAVLTGPDDLYVYILAPGQRVERRPVTTGPTENGLTVISRGITPGETVVTDGQLQLSPGAAVKITPAATAAAAPTPGTP